MKAELERSFGADVTLRPGTGGIFEVRVDGRLVFSKKTSQRFPKPIEISSLIAGNTPHGGFS